MDDAITEPFDDLTRVDDALAEAQREIEASAQTSPESPNVRQQLGASLGQAHHAITRARRNLAAHRFDETREHDQRTALTPFRDLLLRRRGHDPQLIMAVLPLPLDEGRVALQPRRVPGFHENFLTLLSRFNTVEWRRSHRYLLQNDGTNGSGFGDDHFYLTNTPRYETEPTETGALYASGAFVFTRRMISLETPPAYQEDFINEQIEGTVRFVAWLYADMAIEPRAIALQVAVANIPHWDYQSRGQVFRARNTDAYSIVPPQPSVLPFPPDERHLGTAKAEVDITFRLLYLRPMA